MESYSKTVQQIKDLPWHTFSPQSIIEVSRFAAIEFAESVRCALVAIPGDTNLKEMSEGEIQTGNLVYQGYNQTGDHWEFLNYFLLRARSAKDVPQKIKQAYLRYVELMNSMSNLERAMTVFSREKELSEIFQKILGSHNWNDLGFGFYCYFLKKHVELDKAEGGHYDLTSTHELDDQVLLRFYRARLQFYKALES